MKESVRRLGVILGMAAFVAASARGQLGRAGDEFALYGGPAGGGQVRGLDGQLRTIKPGDKIKIKGSDVELTVGEDGLVLPIGASITVNGEPATTPPPRFQHVVALYPLTVFSIGGEQRRRDNSLDGGTRSVVGNVVSYGAIFNRESDRRFEVGAFYFSPYNGNDGDLYQLSSRYFFNRSLGVQVAYLNTTDGHGPAEASSFTYHLLLDLNSVRLGGSDARQIVTRIGIGVLNDLSEQYQAASDTYLHRNTTNFSSFVDLSYPLTRRVSINATEWFIRDRNADLNRLALGVSYQF